MSEWIYGKNVLDAALASNRKIFKVIVNASAKESLKELTRKCESKGIKIETLDSKGFDQKYKGLTQGIVAEVDDYKYVELENVLYKIEKKQEMPFLLVLDSLEDPHNLGAILRTADAAGVHAVLIPKHRNVQLNGTVAKVSTGAIEYVDVVQITNITATLRELKKKGIWIIGAEADAKTDFFHQDYKMPLALVIGSEGKGISRLVRENCDFLVAIPMVGHVNSLNASVSAALMIYEVFKNRK